MKIILCLLAVLLSVAVYPVVLHLNSELRTDFGFIEVDFFNWIRLLLVAPMICFVPLIRNKALALYALLLFVSCFLSRHPETSTYGSPNNHEGLIAILGYLGIFALAFKTGIFPALEKCFRAVVWITAITALLQLIYGNFLNFPLFKHFLPPFEMNAIEWPLYANMGGPNDLGLFCALFLPWALVKRHWLEAIALIGLLIGCQTRGAWVATIITTAFISRRYLLYLALAACLFSLVRHDIVLDRIRVSMNALHYPVRDSDLSGRGYIWRASWPILKGSILTGKGPGTLIAELPQKTPRSEKVLEGLVVGKPHNMFINTWEASGLLSALVLSGFVLGTILLGKDLGFKLGALGFLITGLITDSVLSVTPYFVMFLGGLAREYNET